MVVNFGMEGRIIGYTSVDRSGMNEVKTLFRECPCLAEVFDLEIEVGRNFGGLDGGEVRRDD